MSYRIDDRKGIVKYGCGTSGDTIERKGEREREEGSTPFGANCFAGDLCREDIYKDKNIIMNQVSR